jgi:cytochrome c oxidase cbb3-type subunit 2
MMLLRLLLVVFAMEGTASPRAPGKRDGFQWQARPPSAGVARKPRPARGPALLEEGARLYARECAVCHGERGRADGVLASRLLVTPRDFTQAVFKVRSTPSGSLPTDGDLFQTISRGVHETDMAPYRRLSERQRWALVEHLKTLSPRFSSEEPEPPVQVAPPRTRRATLRKRGEALYVELQCRNCHGPEGRADGPGVADYANDSRKVRIRDLGRGYYVRGSTARDIYLTLRTGLDGTPMGAYDLPPEDLWALAAYVEDVVRLAPLPHPGPRAEDPEVDRSH